MAHKINIENGKAAIVTAKEKPWHGLGIVLPELFTSTDALKYGGLDFEVMKKPIHTRAAGKWSMIEGKYSTVRMDSLKPLGIVGDYYTVIQNRDAFGFFDAIAGEGEAIYETAGALGNGETTFITAKLPAFIEVPGDVVEMYLVLTNTHDGSRPLTAFFTPVKVVCNNTLNAAMRTAVNRVTIRHAKNAKENLAEARKLMGIVNRYETDLKESFNRMATATVPDGAAEQLFLNILLTPEQLRKLAAGEDEINTRRENIIDTIWKYYQTDSTLDAIRGTKFGVYNAVTGYLQNVKNHRSEEAKMENLILCGYDWKLQQKAFEICAV